jgi:hypothetical protein
MGRTGDWEKLRQTLHDAENDRLKYSKHNDFSYLRADRELSHAIVPIGTLA